MALSDVAVGQTKAEGKVKKSDGRGLYLEIRPAGSKYWRWLYRFDGKQKTSCLRGKVRCELGNSQTRRDPGR